VPLNVGQRNSVTNPLLIIRGALVYLGRMQWPSGEPRLVPSPRPVAARQQGAEPMRTILLTGELSWHEVRSLRL
jgi:hypothetical protein